MYNILNRNRGNVGNIVKRALPGVLGNTKHHYLNQPVKMDDRDYVPVTNNRNIHDIKIKMPGVYANIIGKQPGRKSQSRTSQRQSRKVKVEKINLLI